MLNDRRFFPAFWTQFLGAFNDNVFKNALVILITFKAYTVGEISSEQMVALCGGIFILPFFLFSSIAGEVCDKYPKDKLINKIKFAEICIMVLGAVALYYESVKLLLFVLFLTGTQSTFFGPIKYSILPQIVNKDELTKGNALFGIGTFLAILLGTIVGGVAIAVDTIGNTVTAVIIVVLAALGFAFSLGVHVRKIDNGHIKINPNIFKTTVQILNLAWSDKRIFYGILGISWYWLVGAIFLSIFPVYTRDVINGNESIATLILSLFSIGVGIGASVSEKISKKDLDLGVVVLGSMGISLFSIGIGVMSWDRIGEQTNVYAFIQTWQGIFISLLFLFTSISSGMFIIPLYTLIQKISADSIRSRIIAANNIMNALFMVIGSVLLLCMYHLGMATREIFIIVGLCNIAVVVFFTCIYSAQFIRLMLAVFARSFYKLRIEGKGNIPEADDVIFISNHVSFIDWAFIAASSKKTPRFVMWYVFYHKWYLRPFFKMSHTIPIAGRDEDIGLMRKSLKEIRRRLANGETIGFFPEGEITRDGQVDSFKRGLQLIAKDGRTIVPLYIDGMWGSFFSREGGAACSKPHKILPELRRPVTLRIGKPFQFESIEGAREELLKLK